MPPAATDSDVESSDDEATPLSSVDFGSDYWWTDGMPYLDERHIMMLDLGWLTQFKEEERKEKLFHCILPILTLRFDKDNPYKDRVKPMEDRGGNWKSLFLYKDFDVDKSLKEYKVETALEQLINLHNFIVIERAKVMYEKLWVWCAEAYLGLAHYMLHQKMPLGPSERVFQKRKKGTVRAMGTTSPAMVATLGVYKAEAIVDNR
jgi:hypothetical protein